MQYLKGLNGLRFLAALLVLLGHAEMNLSSLNIPHTRWDILFLASDAVHFFFVLSGFLLTYLVIDEFDKTKVINIKRFYWKRVLRIWPLYYLCVLIGFMLLGVVLPRLLHTTFLSFNLMHGLPYFIFFLPNYIASVFQQGVGALFALWSIGVEEQFYLFFPFLMLFALKSKRPLLVICTILVLYTAFYYLQFYHIIRLPIRANMFINTLKFQFMLLGCAAAVLYQKKRTIVKAILPGKKITQVVLFALLAFVFFADLIANYGVYCIASGVLYAAIIINTFSSPVHVINFEKPWLSYLGKISYGIYMFHPYITYPFRYAAEKAAWVRGLFTIAPIVYYVLLLGTTIVVAHLSFKYFESRFLRMKNKV